MNDGQTDGLTAVVVDAHCDTILQIARGHGSLQSAPEAQLDIPRLRQGGVSLQFFALFIESLYKPERTLKRVLQLLDIFYHELEQNSAELALVTSANQLTNLAATGKIGMLLAVEGGEVLEDELGVLRVLYRLGVRSLGLTWNQGNLLADGIGVSIPGGLTIWGEQVVREMNRLGMLVDLAHLAEPGFWDVLRVSEQPVAVTHAACRSLADHPRNLSDNQLRALSQQGGMVGICLVPDFLGQHPDLEGVLDHIEHASMVAGVEHVGLGSDYDGVENIAQGLEHAGCWPRLVQGMERRGFSVKEQKLVLGGNWLRLLHKVLP